MSNNNAYERLWKLQTKVNMMVSDGKRDPVSVANIIQIILDGHIVDCDAPVFIPEKWKVLPEEDQLPRRIRGLVKFDPAKVALHLVDSQKKGKGIEGYNVREELSGTPVYTAHVLDYLLANPHLIPEEWKGKALFFWGTIYKDGQCNFFVRYLYWNDNRWVWFGFRIQDTLDANGTAAVPAS